MNRAVAARSSTFLLILLLPFAGLAQETAGTITGSLADPTGGAITGAAVKLVSEQTGIVRPATSDQEGNFVFSAVAPGTYAVTAESPGFKKTEKQAIELSPGGNLALGVLRLDLGSINESITVRAEGAVVQAASGERAGIVTSEEIRDLTVINRDFTAFAELQPGIVINVNQEVQTFTAGNTFNALGGRTTGNNILIDGIPSNNSNQFAQNTTLSLDALQTVEVKVANFDAEYGRNQGVTILAASKGGGQQVRGSVYYYERNEALNANNYFNNRNNLMRPRYRISNFGGSLSGPLSIPHLGSSRRKLFFFISSEEIREVRPNPTQYITVPTVAERTGDFSLSMPSTIKDPLGGVFPGKIIPASRILQSIQNYLNLLPAPNAFDPAGNYNYTIQQSLIMPKRIETGRLDYNAGSNTQMYARFNYWWEDRQGVAFGSGHSTWGWFPDHYYATTPSGVVSMTHIINPTTVLQASMGYQRFGESEAPLSDAQLQAKTRAATGVDIPQFHPEINPYHVVPAASFGGMSSTNNNSVSWPSRFPLKGAENTFNWNGTVDRVTGNHVLKAVFTPSGGAR